MTNCGQSNQSNNIPFHIWGYYCMKVIFFINWPPFLRFKIQLGAYILGHWHNVHHFGSVHHNNGSILFSSHHSGTSWALSHLSIGCCSSCWLSHSMPTSWRVFLIWPTVVKGFFFTRRRILLLSTSCFLWSSGSFVVAELTSVLFLFKNVPNYWFGHT